MGYNYTGVGMSLPDRFFLGNLPNNSAVVFSQQEHTEQQVICHSALKSSCAAGQWINSQGQPVGSCNHTESAFNSVRLDVGQVSEEGVYSCVIQDEMGVQQKLILGVYQSGAYNNTCMAVKRWPGTHYADCQI